VNAVPDNKGARGSAQNAEPTPDQLPINTKVFAFAAMCVGFFHRTARHPDRVGLAAGYWRRSFGRYRRDCWVQTSYLIAEIIVIPCQGGCRALCRPLAVLCVGGGLYRGEPVGSGLDIPQHDRVSRSAGLSRRL